MHLLIETYDETAIPGGVQNFICSPKRPDRLGNSMDMRGACRRNTAAEALSWPLTSSTDLTNTCSYTSNPPMPPLCARSQFHCTTTTTTTATSTTTTATTKWSEGAPWQYSDCLQDGRVGFSSKLRQKSLLVRSENITRQPTMQTWAVPPDFFLFPGSNPAWKDTILGLLKTRRLPWRMLWKRSQFKTSRRATTRGRAVGNGVLMLKDVILKNIKCV